MEKSGLPEPAASFGSAGARLGAGVLLALFALGLRWGAGYPRCHNDELNWSAIAQQLDQGVEWPVSGPAFVYVLRAAALHMQWTYPQTLTWMGVAGVFIAAQILLWGYRRMGLPTLSPTLLSLALTSYFWAPFLEARPQQWGQVLVFAGALCCWRWLSGRGGWAFFAILGVVAFTHILSHLILLCLCTIFVLVSRAEGRYGLWRSAAVLAALATSMAPYLWPGGPYEHMLDDLRDSHLPRLLSLAPQVVTAVLLLVGVLAAAWRGWRRRPARQRLLMRQLRRRGRVVLAGVACVAVAGLVIQAWLLPAAAWHLYGGAPWRFAIFQAGNVTFAVLFIAGLRCLMSKQASGLWALLPWQFIGSALGAFGLMALAALLGSFWSFDTNWLLRLVNYGVLFAAPVTGAGLTFALQRLSPAWAVRAGIGFAVGISILSVLRPPMLLAC